MSATLCRLCLPIVLAGLTIAGTLGADGIRREPAPSAVHLVGHEDAALLKRVQDVIDDWDPRKLRNPYVDSIPIVDANQKRAVKKSPRRADLNEFIADVDAAEALGKAFFWEMQAGSDFRRQEGGRSSAPPAPRATIATGPMPAMGIRRVYLMSPGISTGSTRTTVWSTASTSNRSSWKRRPPRLLRT